MFRCLKLIKFCGFTIIEMIILLYENYLSVTCNYQQDGSGGKRVSANILFGIFAPWKK
jgi:hypothetical protein